MHCDLGLDLGYEDVLRFLGVNKDTGIMTAPSTPYSNLSWKEPLEVSWSNSLLQHEIPLQSEIKLLRALSIPALTISKDGEGIQTCSSVCPPSL